MCSNSYYFFFLLTLICASFSSFQRQKLRLFLWDLSSFLIYAFNAINFSLSTIFTASHKFRQVGFSFYFRICSHYSWDFFESCVIYKYLISMYLGFSSCLSFIYFSLILLWFESKHCMIFFKICYGVFYGSECGLV